MTEETRLFTDIDSGKPVSAIRIADAYVRFPQHRHWLERLISEKLTARKQQAVRKLVYRIEHREGFRTND